MAPEFDRTDVDSMLSGDSARLGNLDTVLKDEKQVNYVEGLSRGVNLADVQRIKGYSNTWRKLVSMVKARGNVYGGQVPYPERTKASVLEGFSESPDTPQLKLVFDYQLSSMILHSVHPRLCAEAVRGADAVLTLIPLWLSREHETDTLPDLVTTQLANKKLESQRSLDIIDAAVRADNHATKKDDEETKATLYSWFWEFISDQVEMDVNGGSASTLRAIAALSYFNLPMDYEFLRTDYNLGPADPNVSQLVRFMNNLYSWTTEVVTDPDDPHHETVWNSFNSINQHFTTSGGLFVPLTRILSLEKVRRLHRYAYETGDLEYQQISQLIDDTYTKNRESKVTTVALVDQLIKDTASTQVEAFYGQALQGISEIEHEDNLMVYCENPKILSLLSLPEDDYLVVFITFSGEYTVFNYSIFNHKDEDGNSGVWLRYAVKSNTGSYEIYPEVIDEENANQQIKEKLLFLAASTLLEETDWLKHQSQVESLEEDQEPQESGKLEVYTRPGKGPSPMPGMKRKNNRTSGDPIGATLESDIKYVQTLASRKLIEWTNDQLLDIQQNHRYSDKVMRQLRKKLGTFNAGGGIVKSLSTISQVSGSRIFEVKSSAYRIIAQVLPGGKAELIDIVPSGEQDIIRGQGL